MEQIACAACGARFDLTADLPGVFTCGACGAEVRGREPLPRRPAREGPARRSGRAPAPPGRPAGHHYREELETAAKKDRRALVVGIVAAVVCAVAGLIVFFTAGSRGAEPRTEAGSPARTPTIVAPMLPRDAVPAQPEEAPAAAAAEPAPAAAEKPPGPPPEPEETGSPELVRFKNAARRAKTAQEHVEAGRFGRSQLDAVRKKDPASAEIADFEQRIRKAFEGALSVDPAFEAAHAELGHVRYDKARTEAWLKSDLVPTVLRTSLEETLSELAGAGAAAWLSGADAEKHGRVLAEAEALHEDRAASKVSWFYDKATRAAKRIEGEVGVYLSASRDQDAFDPVIFRPYLLLVQKDPSQRSVDRAYEVVLLVRTLEETWRRRYAKEIDFSGSMSAPPIILLRSREAYEKYQTRHETKPVMSAGHYEPYDRRMVIYKSSPEEERVVIFHEGTHMLFDHKNAAKDPAVQVQQSMWFSEGIAEYFGGHGPSGERDPATSAVIWEPGRVNDTRIGSIALARTFKKLIKFEDLIKITRLEWTERHVKDPLWSEMTYAQGWALVYFLNHGESGKYQKDFVEYMKLELSGKSGMEAFQQSFGKHGLDAIEKGYTAFLDFIVKKHRDKKIVGGKILE